MTQAVEAAGGAGAPSADGELGVAPGLSPAPSRRDRLRAATIEEIIATARRLLVTSGPEAVSLRAIAREMGMTAPGLYRYFDSHEELLRHVSPASSPSWPRTSTRPSRPPAPWSPRSRRRTRWPRS